MANEKTQHEPIRLNKTEVEGLKPRDKDYFNPVEGHQGLYVRVLPNGEKSFVLRYRFHGIQKKHVIGRFPGMLPEAAKKAHNAAWGLINSGTEPNEAKTVARKAAEEARRAAVTVKDLANRYELEHLPASSEVWQKESKRLIEKHILPALGKIPIQDVSPADISALLFKLSQKTPVQANRVRAVLRTMFQRAEEWSLRPLGTNPVSVVKARHPEVKRYRRLSDFELQALGKAMNASKTPPEYLIGLRLGLVAGMRKGEIQGLRWEWVNLQTNEIRIPPEHHKTGKKTGRARIIHLCSSLAADIKALVPTLGCPYVIPGRPSVGKNMSRTWKPFTALQNPWEQLRVAAGLAKKEEAQDQDPGLHDLRRTYASVAADLGLKGFVGELIGHAEQSVTDIYTRTAAQRLLEAAETVGSRIDGILKGVIDPEKEAKAREAKAAKKAKKSS